MAPLVSILIPAYNAEPWIADTLQSALVQTWPRKEIIVVDDGSRDGTLSVARRFECEGVRVFTQPNQGGPAARNRAFELSRGEYIQWLDHDDLLSPDKIERQMGVASALKRPRMLLSCAQADFMYRPQRARFRPTALWHDLSPVEWLIAKMGQNLYMQTSTWLTSRDLASAAGKWNTEMLTDDDGEYYCRVLLQSEGVRFVSGPRVYLRNPGPGRASHLGRSARKVAAQWHSIKLHIGYLLSLEDSPRTRAVCVTYIQNWLFYFYPERIDLVAEARELARGLGGKLSDPKLRWKYSWMAPVIGYDAAKSLQLALPNIRWSVARAYDRALFRLSYRQPSHLLSVQSESRN